jgi:hypothetical protein
MGPRKTIHGPLPFLCAGSQEQMAKQAHRELPDQMAKQAHRELPDQMAKQLQTLQQVQELQVHQVQLV